MKQNLAKNKLKIKRYGKLMRIANWLQQIPNKVTPAPFRLVQIGSAFWQSRALYVAAKLGVADEIGDTEKSTMALAEALSLDEDHLYRLMRMLASIGVFTETAPRKFRNSKLSNALRGDNPKNVRAMVLMHNSDEMSRPWFESLEQSIRDGSVPFEDQTGVGLFEYMSKNQEFDQLFSRAMDSIENVAGTDFIDDLNWTEFTRIIDVGGSRGSKSLAILKSNPNLQAVVYDRPQIIAGAKEKWLGKVNESILQRIEFVGGDMLENIPPATSVGDVYLFVAVLHSFDDTECKRILENMAQAMGEHACYAVIADMLADEVNTDSFVAAMDMQMLMGTRGRERTLTEWRNLFNETGFEIDQILDIRSLAKYIVLRRN